jgi:KUP system potassium uptake protein
MAPGLHPFIVPTTIGILVALFAIQRHGTGRVGALFGPVMCLWFVVIAVLGALGVARQPGVLAAINPQYAVGFFVDHPTLSFLALGAIVLAVTGTEALYADMGHFGKSPIRRAWALFVMPALVLNYFGQGALILADPSAVKNPFYLLAPAWGLLPLVMLATCATVIASQAVISGAFSLTRQAIQMGYCPRLTITHTSERQIGQIYIPFINWALLIAVILLVIGFRSSSNLAGAYGIAVTLAMLIDSISLFVVMRRLWRWPTALATVIAVPFFVIDVAFLASNSLKIPEGGWFPILSGIVVFTVLTTWKRGRAILMKRLSDDAMPLDLFIQSVEASPPTRVEGTAIFLTSSLNSVPPRTAAQPEAQQSAARAYRVPDRRDRRRSDGAGRRTLRGQAAGLRFLPDHRALRLQGRPGHPGTPRRVRTPRIRLRHDGDVVLRVAGNADSHRGPRHGALAREAVRVDVQERDQGVGLLPHSVQSRRGTGHAGRALGCL